MKPAISDREGFAAFVLRMRSLGLTDQRLMSAFEATPRTAFVNGNLGNVAYGDGTLPIECGEFIEGLDLQAQLIKALDLEPGHRVLEIGTGSGFTAAVMARLSGRVLSLERYRTLVELAQQRLQALKIENTFIKHTDGRHGQVHDGPFDRIIVWGAFEAMPRQFVESAVVKRCHGGADRPARRQADDRASFQNRQPLRTAGHDAGAVPAIARGRCRRPLSRARV